MDFKLFLCVLFFLLNCAIFGHARSIDRRQTGFEAGPVVPETVNMDEPVNEPIETTFTPEIAETTFVPDVVNREEMATERIPEVINREQIVTERVPEVIEHAEIATTMIPETVERVETVTQMVPETIERSEILTTRVPDVVERVEPVTRTFTEVFERPQVYTTMVPETVERSEILTTRVPEVVTHVEPVTRTYTEIIEHPEIRTTMVPEVITHSEPEFEIVTEIIEHPEIMTTMIPETISRRVPLTTVISEVVGERTVPLTTMTSEIVGEHVEAQTTMTNEVVGEHVEPQTEIVAERNAYVQPQSSYVPPQTNYVAPQIPVGNVVEPTVVDAEPTLSQMERDHKLRVAKLVDMYIAQLEAPARIQAQIQANAEAARLQAQQNIANAQRGLVAPALPGVVQPAQPAIVQPAVARPVYPAVAAPTYTTLQDQINAQIANAQALAEANRQKVLADVARIQEENRIRVAELQERNRAYLASIGVPAVAPVLPYTTPLVKDPCNDGPRPLATGTYVAPAASSTFQETPFQRLKRQAEENQKKIAANVQAQQDKLKADIESLKQKNDEALQKLLHPITVRPTVVMPVTKPPTIIGAPVVQTAQPVPPTATQLPALKELQDKTNAQIAVDNARAKSLAVPQTIQPTAILPAATQAPTLEELQQRLKEQMQENQRKLEQTLEENRLRLEKQQEETKARLASLLPAQPTVFAPQNPVIQTTEVPITRQPDFQSTFETTPKTFARKLKSQVEEQQLKTLSNAERIREDNREANTQPIQTTTFEVPTEREFETTTFLTTPEFETTTFLTTPEFETTTFLTTPEFETTTTEAFDNDNAQSIADKLKAKVEEQRLKNLSNAEKIREENRQRLDLMNAQNNENLQNARSNLNEKLDEPKQIEATTVPVQQNA